MFWHKKTCSICGKEALDKMENILFCRGHLKEKFRQSLIAYRYPLIIIEPERDERGQYLPFLDFFNLEDLQALVEKEDIEKTSKLLMSIDSKTCSRCEDCASRLYFSNTVFKKPLVPDYQGLENYPKNYLCRDHVWEKLEGIINATSRHYGEAGNVGITTPYGSHGGIYASSFYE